MAMFRALSGNGGGGGGSISDYIFSAETGIDLGSGKVLDVSDTSKEYLVGVQRAYSPTTEYYSAIVKNGTLTVTHNSLPSYYNTPTLNNGHITISYANSTPATNVLLVTITP